MSLSLLDDEPSNERTITVDSDSSKAAVFDDAMIGGEVDPKGIEATLCQIAMGLRHASDGYLVLALHITHVTLYELPQVIAQNSTSSHECTNNNKEGFIDRW